MKFYKVLVVIWAIIILSGCYKEPYQRGHINLNENISENFKLIYLYSKQCFEKKSGLFSDGVLVLPINNKWHNRITFHRYALDIGLTEPFIILDFRKNKLFIKEGSYKCSFIKCTELNIKKSILEWINGTRECVRN